MHKLFPRKNARTIIISLTFNISAPRRSTENNELEAEEGFTKKGLALKTKSLSLSNQLYTINKNLLCLNGICSLY